MNTENKIIPMKAETNLLIELNRRGCSMTNHYEVGSRIKGCKWHSKQGSNNKKIT